MEMGYVEYLHIYGARDIFHSFVSIKITNQLCSMICLGVAYAYEGAHRYVEEFQWIIKGHK